VEVLIQNLFNGLTATSVYLMIALGVTAVFGLTRLINFAHGQLLIVGAYVAYDFTSRGVNFVWGALAAIAVCGLLGWLSERALFRFTLSRPINGLIVGLGLLLLLEGIAALKWGVTAHSVTSPFSDQWTFGGVVLSQTRIMVLAVAIVVLLALLWALKTTSIGMRTRATQENASAAAHAGINVGRTITTAFTVGSALAGLAGALLGTLFPIDPNDGGYYILKGFAIALLGGLGNIVGVVVSSGIYGLGETFVAGYLDPEYVPIFTYGLIMVVLLLFPTGIMRSASDHGGQSRSVRPAPTPLRAVDRSVVGVVALALSISAISLTAEYRLKAILLLAVVYCIQALALSLVYNNTGILSLGQSGFMLVGAYAAALAAEHFGWNFWLGTVFAAPFGALAGALLGLFVARSRGHYMLLVTYAFSSLIVQLANLLDGLTHGDHGIINLDEIPSVGPFTFGSIEWQYYLGVFFCLLIAILCLALPKTLWGTRLAAIRENEALARSLGAPVAIDKILIFALSGAISAAGAALFVYTQHAIVPSSFGAMLGVQFAIMLVLGGRSILGAVVGAAILTIVPELVGLQGEDQKLAVGVILIAVMLLLPEGVMVSLHRLYLAGTRRFAKVPAVAPAVPRSLDGGAQSLEKSSSK
jgi:branched-chain amino acid transport system permease protein